LAVGDSIILEMSEIASRDKYKGQYLEIRIGFHGDIKERLLISFAEFHISNSINITSCFVSCQRHDRDYFIIEHEKKVI